MCTLKHFRSAFVALIAIATFFLLPGCDPTTPSTSNSSTTGCPSPKPLITFDALNSDGFNVTPDTLPGATKVIIEVYGSTGAPQKIINGLPGVASLLELDTSFHRPLRVRFIYKAANEDTLATDEVCIDDTPSHGVTLPDMDVVMGVINFPSCPPATTTVNATTTGGLTYFNWNANDSFQVVVTYNSVDYKFRVHPTLGVGDNAGKVTIHENPSHTCLTDINTQAVSTKEIAVTSVANNCTVRGWNNGYTRTITIKHPSTATVAVKK